MAVTLNQTNAHNRHRVWCGCCGDLNDGAHGKYVRMLRRQVKRRERQAWKKSLHRD